MPVSYKVVKTRTIKHPGVEFISSELNPNSTINKNLVSSSEIDDIPETIATSNILTGDNTKYLAIGYSSSGPTYTPMKLSSANEFEIAFGQPESDAEFQSWYGVNRITEYADIYFIRLPYDNSLTAIDNNGNVITKYKTLKYNFIDSQIDVSNVYDEQISTKNLNVTTDVLSADEIKSLNDCDFAIINYNNNIGTKKSDYFVSVIGCGNSFYKQGLTNEDIQIYNNQLLTIKDPTKLSFGKSTNEWQYDIIETLNSNLINNNGAVQLKANKKVNPKYNGYITVIVSKITNNTIDGKFNISQTEVYYGHICKGHKNISSLESDYIGDIINRSSPTIKFIGKETYSNYDANSSVLIVNNQKPYRLSIIDKMLKSNKSSDLLSIKKAILSKSNKSIDYSNTVLKKALAVIKDPTIYKISDIFDFGTSSVISCAIEDSEGDLVYNTTTINQDEEINYDAWLKFVKKISHYCNYTHSMCMYHADAPRSLLLSGSLTKKHDLNLYPIDNSILSKLQISDYNFSETNIMWYEVLNTWYYKKTWVPMSIFTANNIAINDAIRTPWTPTAGINYGLITNVYRAAIDLEEYEKDIVYSFNMNFGDSCITNKISPYTIQGIKTNFTEISELRNTFVRRLVNHLKFNTIKICSKYIGYTNNISTWNSVTTELSEKLYDPCVSNNGISEYKIICDSTINTDLTIAAGELRLQILIKPVHCVEYILCNLILVGKEFNVEEIWAGF